MIADLRRFRQQGLSTREIALKLGVSRNSAIGKIHRLKLPTFAAPEVKGPRPPRTRKPRPQRRYGLAAWSTPAAVATPVTVTPGAGHPVTFADLDMANDCRAILDARGPGGETMYCGCTRGFAWNGKRSSYCAIHHAQFWVKPPAPRDVSHRGRE
jgi:GcrA cell cycle regulator